MLTDVVASVSRESGGGDGWDVSVRVFFVGGAATSGHVITATVAGTSAKTSATVPAPSCEGNTQGSDGTADDNVVEMTLHVGAQAVDTWWPAGLGAQQLYVSFTSVCLRFFVLCLQTRIFGCS